MTKLWFSMLACLFLAQPGATSQPVDIAVRLVYLDTGKPADGQQVILYEGKPSASTTRFTQTTAGDGVARFRLSVPPPETVWVDDNNGRIRNCAWEDQVHVSEILAQGVTIAKDNRFGSSCKGKQDTVSHLRAKPGEIVVFVRRVGNWDNLRHY
jgi:hypothetical protein